MATRKLGSVKGTDAVLITSVNLAADVGGSVLPVANGGNGTGTFLDGQILIGQTAGNTLVKSTLTGTANQVVVTNGGGSITLSTPQAIGTGSSPTFAGATLSGMTAGSVLFAGTGGLVSQDNANLFYDDANNRLRIGTNALAAGDWYDGKLYVALSGAPPAADIAARFRMDYSGTHQNAYAPVELACVYTSTSAVDAFTQTYSGLQSTLYYGTAATAARGTCCSMVSQIVSVNSGDNEDELAPWEGVVRFDNTNNGFPNLTPGRAWMTDWAVHGAIGQQQGALGGVHSFMNNYYAGPPRDGMAGAFWACTGQGAGTALDYYHLNAPTYQLGVGFGVVGFSTGGFTRGWEIGLQVGGSGSNWNTAASHVGTGVDISDYDNVGLWLRGPFTGLSRIYVTNGGSGYTSQPAVVIAAPQGTGTVLPSAITVLTATTAATGAGAITVTTAGSGYTASQELYCTFSAPYPSGCPAAAKVTADGSGNVAGATALVFGASGTVTATVGVNTAVVAAGGTGYVVGDVLTISGGTSTTTAQLRVDAVTAGVITGVSVTRVGVYSVLPSNPASVTGGTGASATFTLNWKFAGITFLAGGSAYPKSRAGDLPVSFVISSNRSAYGFATTDASGIITAVTLSNAGSGHTAAGTATVDTYGSGYTALPTITIPAPVTGTRAIATAVLAGTSVAAVYITSPGKGYGPCPPTVILNAGGGSGATAAATVTGCGLLKDATITAGGTGYSPIDPPVVTISGGQGASGTVTTTVTSGALVTVVPTAAGAAYPKLSIVYLTVAGGTGGIIAANTNSAGGLNIAGSGCTVTITVSGGALVTATVAAGGTLYPANSFIILSVASGTNGVIAVATGATGICAGTAIILRAGSGYSAGTNATALACYILAGGSGYSATTAATANYLTATAKAVINIYGNVTATFVTDPGSGYSSAPTVTIAAPVVRAAQGYATVVANVVTAVTVTLGGNGYVGTTPTISFSGGGGSNAAASAVSYFGTVKYVTVTNGGTSYSSVPAVTFTAPAAGTQATASGRLGGCSILVEAGAGPVVLGNSGPIFSDSVLEVMGASSSNPNVAAFGSTGSTDANGVVLRNGNNQATWWLAGSAGQFLGTSLAQDSGFVLPTASSFWLEDATGVAIFGCSLGGGASVTPTWNAAGTTFAGLKVNATNTASAAGSKLLDLQVAAASKFSVGKAGDVTIAAGTTAVAPLNFTGGTNLTTPIAGATEFDGVAYYNTSDATNGRRVNDAWSYFRLTGSGTGITTIADFFGANSAIPLVANGVYEVEWVCYFSQATAGTATWTVVTATTALANLTGEYVGSPVGGIGAVGTPQTAGVNATSSSSTAFPVTGTEATAATHYFRVRVLLTAGNGAGNVRLRLTMSAGTATPLINSYFRARRLPAGNTGTFVA